MVPMDETERSLRRLDRRMPRPLPWEMYPHTLTRRAAAALNLKGRNPPGMIWVAMPVTIQLRVWRWRDTVTIGWRRELVKLDPPAPTMTVSEGGTDDIGTWEPFIGYDPAYDPPPEYTPYDEHEGWMPGA